MVVNGLWYLNQQRFDGEKRMFYFGNKKNNHKLNVQ